MQMKSMEAKAKVALHGAFQSFVRMPHSFLSLSPSQWNPKCWFEPLRISSSNMQLRKYPMRMLFGLLQFGLARAKGEWRANSPFISHSRYGCYSRPFCVPRSRLQTGTERFSLCFPRLEAPTRPPAAQDESERSEMEKSDFASAHTHHTQSQDKCLLIDQEKKQSLEQQLAAKPTLSFPAAMSLINSPLANGEWRH